MTLPDALAEAGCSLHEEIEERFSRHAQGGTLLPRKTAVRVGDGEICPRSGRIIKPGAADANAAHEPDTWCPRKGDTAPKDGPLAMPQLIGYCEEQVKKWQKQAKADDFKEMKCCDAYSLLSQQANHIAELLKRLKPAASVSHDTASAKAVVKKLLSAICDNAKVISTADAVRILVPAFPDLFGGTASLKGAGKRLQGMLRGLDVSSDDIRINGRVLKGYRVTELRHAVV